MAEVMAETERLRLRTWDFPDRAEFKRLLNRPNVMRWLGGVASEADSNAAFDRTDAYQRDYGFTFWIVERKDDGEILGFCGLKRANSPGADLIAGEVEIGWRLREDAWGQGYAKEAAIASLDLAFEKFAAPRVVAVTAEGNLPSQGLMIRLGMTRRPELDFVDLRFPPDSDVNPQFVFAIEADDWSAARKAALGG
jgi:RimJ/RimL family protein N-acetyltransferase